MNASTVKRKYRLEGLGCPNCGAKIEARVAAVKADGKLDLSIRHRNPEQMDAYAQKIV